MVRFSEWGESASEVRQHHPSGGSPICLDVLLDRCMDDPSFALALLSELEQSAPALLDRLAAEVERGETDAVAESMHALKGATGIVAAEQLSELARRGEVAGRLGDLARVRELLPAIQVEMTSCLDSLPLLRQQLS